MASFKNLKDLQSLFFFGTISLAMSYFLYRHMLLMALGSCDFRGLELAMEIYINELIYLLIYL